jgi:hypothetical protein
MEGSAMNAFSFDDLAFVGGLSVDYWFPPTPYSYFAAIRSTNYGTPTNTLTTPAGAYPGINAFAGGVLLPDGRVFCVPSISASARIYDPITDTLITPSGTYPGGTAFFGGVLLPDGRVFCIPRSNTSARIYGSALTTQLPNARVLSAYDNKL